jgi:energy-coupling factor transporter ATP-binding protein EcfA2
MSWMLLDIVSFAFFLKMPETEVERKHSQVRAKEIDEYLQKERKEYLKYKSEPKLLILGSSDSGKSTLLKQLKILHGNGFSDHEKELSRRGIISNIINALALLLNLAEGPFAEEKREVFIIDKEYKTINMVQEEWSPRDTDVPTELIPLLKQAWDEVVVQDAFKNTPHGLPDTTA